MRVQYDFLREKTAYRDVHPAMLQVNGLAMCKCCKQYKPGPVRWRTIWEGRWKPYWSTALTGKEAIAYIQLWASKLKRESGTLIVQVRPTVWHLVFQEWSLLTVPYEKDDLFTVSLQHTTDPHAEGGNHVSLKGFPVDLYKSGS